MNRQDLFNRAYAGLWAQGCKSLKTGGACAYRGVLGRRCAIGMLLISDEWARYFDSPTTTPQWTPAKATMGHWLSILLGATNRAEADFLAAMQRELHDGFKDGDDFHSNLNYGAGRLARTFDLELPPGHPKP